MKEQAVLSMILIVASFVTGKGLALGDPLDFAFGLSSALYCIHRIIEIKIQNIK